MIALFGILLSLSTLLVVFLMGTSRRVTGYWLGVPTQVAWCAYVLLAVYQPALLVLQAPLLAIYVRHLLASRHRAPEPDIVPDLLGRSIYPAHDRPQPEAPVVIGVDPFAEVRARVLAPWMWKPDAD